MQLAYILVAAFAILADARRNRADGYQYQRKDAAQVNNGSYAGFNAGSTTGSDSGSSSGTGTSTGSGTTDSGSSSSSGNKTASFTQYGPCNIASKTSCAWYSSSGYNAAISQAAYGGYPGSGPSGACGQCWQLTPDYAGAHAIVVKVNNLCPNTPDNPLCALPEDVNINFDLCEDSGAATALFGSSGTQQVNGTAAIVDCSQWHGGPNV